MEKIRTKINEKWVDEDGILHIKALGGVLIDLPSLKEDDAVNPQLTGGKKVLALYDGRASFDITPDAQAYVRSGILNKSRIATAVVTNQSLLIIIVNFMNVFGKPESPLRMFRDEKEAMKWLHSFRVN